MTRSRRLRATICAASVVNISAVMLACSDTSGLEPVLKSAGNHSQRAQAPSDPALVAAYGFDETNGPTVVDASSQNNSGTIGSGVTRTTSGRYGGALSFSGTGRVTIADAASLRLTQAMTLEAWVNPSTVNNSWRDVVYKADDNYYLMATSTNNSRPAGGASFGNTSATTEAYGTAALPAGVWTHLAVTYDGSTIRLFVNGTQVSTVAKTGSFTTSANPLQIGGNAIYGQFFQGLIDEVRVYNRPLSAGEIQTDMNTPVGTTTPPPTDTVPALVAAYGFDETSGPTVVDASSQNNSGTIGSGVTRTTSGRYGGALSFSGTGRVTIADAASLRLTQAMTLEAWVNPSTVNNSWRDVVYKADDNYYLMATSTNNSRPAGGASFGNTAATTEAYGTAALPTGVWTHLAVTYDGSTIRLFVNGTQVSTVAKTGSFTTSANPLQIG